MEEKKIVAHIIGNLNHGDHCQQDTQMNEPRGSIIGAVNYGSNVTMSTTYVVSKSSLPLFDETHKENIYGIQYSDVDLIDRPEKLKELSDTLSQNKFKGRIINLHGYGGVGKSTLLRSYLRLGNDEFKGKIFYFSASTKDELCEGYRELGALIPCEIEPVSTLSSNIKAWFSNRREWLIVLDNVKDLHDISKLLPLCAHGTLLLISRTKIISQDIKLISIPLDVFNPNESAQFMKIRLEQPTSPEILKITEELSHLPLALEHCCSLMTSRQWSPAEFLNEYATQSSRIIAWSPEDQHMRSLKIIWELTFKSIEHRMSHHQYQHTLKLIYYFSLTSPKKFSYCLFEHLAGGVFNNDMKLINNMVLTEFLDVLEKHSVVKVTRTGNMLSNFYSIHRLLQEVIFSQLTLTEQFNHIVKLFQLFYEKLIHYKNNGHKPIGSTDTKILLNEIILHFDNLIDRAMSVINLSLHNNDTANESMSLPIEDLLLISADLMQMTRLGFTEAHDRKQLAELFDKMVIYFSSLLIDHNRRENFLKFMKNASSIKLEKFNDAVVKFASNFSKFSEEHATIIGRILLMLHSGDYNERTWVDCIEQYGYRVATILLLQIYMDKNDASSLKKIALKYIYDEMQGISKTTIADCLSALCFSKNYNEIIYYFESSDIAKNNSTCRYWYAIALSQLDDRVDDAIREFSSLMYDNTTTVLFKKHRFPHYDDYLFSLISENARTETTISTMASYFLSIYLPKIIDENEIILEQILPGFETAISQTPSCFNYGLFYHMLSTLGQPEAAQKVKIQLDKHIATELNKKQSLELTESWLTNQINLKLKPTDLNYIRRFLRILQTIPNLSQISTFSQLMAIPSAAAAETVPNDSSPGIKLGVRVAGKLSMAISLAVPLMLFTGGLDDILAEIGVSQYADVCLFLKDYIKSNHSADNENSKEKLENPMEQIYGKIMEYTLKIFGNDPSVLLKLLAGIDGFLSPEEIRLLEEEPSLNNDNNSTHINKPQSNSPRFFSPATKTLEDLLATAQQLLKLALCTHDDEGIKAHFTTKNIEHACQLQDTLCELAKHGIVDSSISRELIPTSESFESDDVLTYVLLTKDEYALLLDEQIPIELQDGYKTNTITKI